MNIYVASSTPEVPAHAFTSLQKMSHNNQTILITGSAGFIGSNLVLRLLENKEPLNIVGLDWRIRTKLTPLFRT